MRGTEPLVVPPPLAVWQAAQATNNSPPRASSGFNAMTRAKSCFDDSAPEDSSGNSSRHHMARVFMALFINRRAHGIYVVHRMTYVGRDCRKNSRGNSFVDRK